MHSYNLIQQLYQTSGGISEKSRLSRRRGFTAALSFPFGKCDNGDNGVQRPAVSPSTAAYTETPYLFLVPSSVSLPSFLVCFSLLHSFVYMKETNQVGIF